MFRKVLVANRGEIAVRIMTTLRRMGVGAVAVYSEADSNAAHVRMADEAIAIGPALAARSYLNSEVLIEAARTSGAQAIHPGYGFLSENAEFAEACSAAGLAFIGPPSDVVAVMGDKLRAKEIARKAGVPVVPGAVAALDKSDAVYELAAEIGYPVMVKAASGGGGKGMRIVRSADELDGAIALAGSEAKASFGDDRLFLERFLERPRHIEIQILADGQGSVVQLGERECSIQRRHQKIVEECPSQAVSAEMRAAMGDAAIALARAVGYRSAGTVEYIVDQAGKFYFLEMNTRLQVEHPVTELVYGLDLVEWMVRIAAGERLVLSPRQSAARGWAIEVRICAEDPDRGFLPSTGLIKQMIRPALSRTAGDGSDQVGVRLDCGVEEGDSISVHYDPMMAKLIAYGETRPATVAMLRQALGCFGLSGIKSNLSFLAAILADETFQRADLSTAFIEERFGDGFRSSDIGEGEDVDLLIALAGWACAVDGAASPVTPPLGSWAIRVEGRIFALSFPQSGKIVLDDREHDFVVRSRTYWPLGLVSLLWNGAECRGFVHREGNYVRVARDAHSIEARVYPDHILPLLQYMPTGGAAALDRFVRAPMPGLLSKLFVAVKDRVTAGQPLATIVAMKMESPLLAERDGVIKEILIAEGDGLAVDQEIFEFESEESL